MSLGSYIKQLRKEKKISSQEVLAQKLGVTRSAINMWERDERTPSIPVMKDMAKLFDVKVTSFLKYIIGEDTLYELEGNMNDQIKEKNAPYLFNTEYYTTGELVKIPVVGSVKAGRNGLAYEDFQGYETINSADVKGGDYIYLKIKGDSMSGDGIFWGDLALVKLQSDIESGQLAIVLINGEEAMIKRIYINENNILIQPSNPVYTPQVFVSEEMENIKIIGQVKQVIKKY